MDQRSFLASALCSALLFFLAACGGGDATGPGSSGGSQASGGPGAGGRFEDSAAYALYQTGKKFREQGQFDRARAELERAYELDPFQPRLLDEIAQLMIESGMNLENSRLRLNEWLAQYPDHAGMHAKLGTVLTLMQRPREALAALSRSLELDPKQPEVYYRLGRTQIYLSDTKEGSQVLDLEQLEAGLQSILSAIELAPDEAEYRMWAGRALERKGDIDAALERYAEAIERDPSNGDYYLQVGAVHSSRGELEEAKAALDKALELSEEDYTLWFEVGRLAEQMEDLPRAREAYEKAIALAPTREGAHFRLGTVLVQLGEEDAAEEALAAAERWEKLRSELRFWHVEVKNAPDDAESAARLGASYLALQEHTEATQWLRRALDLDRKNVNANYSLGRLFLETGEYERSAAHFGVALEGEPGNPGILRQLALAQYSAEQFEPLRATVEQLLPLSPQDATVHHLMGLALMGLGQAQEAQAHLRQALAVDETYDDARVALAGALIETEDWDAAVQACQEVLQRDPANQAARDLLEQAQQRGR